MIFTSMRPKSTIVPAEYANNATVSPGNVLVMERLEIVLPSPSNVPKNVRITGEKE